MQLRRLQEFVRSTSDQWRMLFETVSDPLDSMVGVGFVVDGWSVPLLVVAYKDHPFAFFDDPHFKGMPDPWREVTKLFVTRAFDMPSSGMLRVVLVRATKADPFVISFFYELERGAVS